MEAEEPREDDPLAGARHPAAREVYRDDVLWVLDKPSGILSHPNPPAAETANALIRGRYDFEREAYALPPGAGKVRDVYLVHRLDQETSGLIVCAFKERTALALKEALAERQIVKEYRAVLIGVPEPRRGQWADRLEKSSRDGRATVLRRPGEPNAFAAYQVLKVFEPSGLALVALWPETGRTHQLRVQAAARGFPIAGDERYGDFTANRFLAAEAGLKRMFLHARHVEFRHPETGHLLKLDAPFTIKLEEPLERMRGLLVAVPRRAAGERSARSGPAGRRKRRRR